MAAKKRSAGSICPITQNPVLRNEVAQHVEAIRDAFPKGVSAPALRALVDANLTTLDSLTKVTEAGVARLHGMGTESDSGLENGVNGTAFVVCEVVALRFQPRLACFDRAVRHFARIMDLWQFARPHHITSRAVVLVGTTSISCSFW